MLKEKIILESFQEKKKVRSDFFFQTGRRFNISVTLLNYCGGSQGEGVRKIVHGYPWGDEFPTWSFEIARCVFVYTKDNLCPLYRGGGTYSELVCMGIYIFINLLLYIFILIYLYKYVCMCICMYVFL